MEQAATVLRAQMVARLIDAGVVVTASVAEALQHVPRHLFVPQVDAHGAYLDEAVMVKHADDGSPISSASQPTMVAIMLERLQVASGHRVLEVGTGTGYNAALLAALAGDDGYVVSVELERDLADAALRSLAGFGQHRIEVVIGDGREGCLRRAPYDRVIVTTGATRVAWSWRDQLASGGRLVVPLVNYSGAGSVVVFDKIDGGLVRVAEDPCGFLPIRDTPTP